MPAGLTGAACVVEIFQFLCQSTYTGIPSVTQYISIAGVNLLTTNRKLIVNQILTIVFHLVYLLNHSFIHPLYVSSLIFQN